MAFHRNKGRPRRGEPPEASDRRIRRVHESGARSRRKLVFTFGGVVLLVIAGLVLGGWYKYYYAPPRVNAAFIHDTRFNQGDLVKRVRMIQAAQNYSGTTSIGITDILRVLYNPDIGVSAGPFSLGMVQMELLKQGAPEYGVTVTDEEIDNTVRAIFTPEIPQGQEATADQIERESQERYKSFLNLNRISDGDYRRLTEENIYFRKMLQTLGANIASETEQVEVSWVRVPQRPDATLEDPDKWQDLKGIRKRLQEEDFGKVAQEFSSVFKWADPNGYVGWVPKGAFPDLDPVLFGGNGVEPLAPGEVSEAIPFSGYNYFIRVEGDREVKEVPKKWTQQMQAVALETWLLDRFEQGTSEGWLGVKYDSKIYSWAAKQLRQTAQQRRGGKG